MVNVFNFSGGKTSAYMTLKYYKPGDIVIFCDTGREHPKTYKFINDFEAHENIPVVRLGGKNAFSDLIKNKKYKVVPNRMKRFCTDELKIKTAKRYLKSIGIISFNNYIGFRHDEKKRIDNRVQKFKKVFDKFPLYDDGITKGFINMYWMSKPYNLEIPAILGNCTLCFMKGINAVLSILREYPELANEWIDDEQLGRTYFKGVSIKELRSIAQNNLFKDYPLEEIQPQYSCKCGL